MEVIHYQHSKSQKSLGIMFLVWAAIWPVMPAALLFYTGNLEEFLIPPVIIGMITVDVILIALAIWNIKKGGFFYYKVGSESVECDYPGRPDVSYKIPMEDIDHLYKKYNYSSSGTRVDYYIIENNGSRNLIPSAYMLHVTKVTKAIQKVRPELQLLDSKTRKA